MPTIIISRFTFYVSTPLNPSDATPSINPHMTSIRVTTIIINSTNRHNTTVTTQRNTIPTFITNRFTVYVGTFLTPSTTTVFVNSHMTSIATTTIIINRPNRHDSTIITQRNTPPTSITSRFAVYIRT